MSASGVLASAGMVAVRRGRPLPLHPGGSVPIGPAGALLESDEGGAVSLWGMVASCWDAGDIVARRLAAVNLMMTRAATQPEICAAFGVDDATLRRWTRAFESEGTGGLRPEKRGPKQPSKLTRELATTIRGLRAEARSLAAIAEATGVSVDTVRRALASEPSPKQSGSTGLVPLAKPAPREVERALAHAGLLAGAAPVICEGESLPLAGALLVLPGLAVTGLFDAVRLVYGVPRAAFYSLYSLVLSLVFAALLGEPRVEGFTRMSPVDLGRLIGLDRAPEVGTVRRRVEALAGARRSGELLGALAANHAGAHPGEMGILYLDGHVRAYHGGSDLPRAHLARARDRDGGDHRHLARRQPRRRGARVVVGAGRLAHRRVGRGGQRGAQAGRERRHPDDRLRPGGWSPACFKKLVEAGFHIITYRKAPLAPEPRSAFSWKSFTDDFGHEESYLLADRAVRIPYDAGRRYFSCRQVTRLDEASGHQTQVITTWGNERSRVEVARSMFGRWREENLFRFMRPRGLDAMDSYAKMADEPDRVVPNPEKKKAKAELAKAKAALAAAEATEGRVAFRGEDAGSDDVRSAYDDATAFVEEMAAAYRAIPAKVPLGEARPDAVRLDDERKRIHDAIRMATWNAESALARALAPHYRRAEDEAHSLLAEAFKTSADFEIIGDELHVRLEQLSAPRRSRAIAALCAELTATETTYPGTELRLVYSVKGF